MIQIITWFSFLTLRKTSSQQVLSSRPFITVLICAKNEESHIAKCLESVLIQKYPSYEIIVANDYSGDDTSQKVENIKKLSDKVTSFIPSEDVIGKKKAIVEGVSRARGSWIILMDADCHAISENWLSSFACLMENGTDVVLGFGDVESAKNKAAKLFRYETLYIAYQYMTAARLGHAYMGVGRNLAFRKSAFEEQNPFGNNLHGFGDDDAIVSALSRCDNTEINLNPDGFTCSNVSEDFSFYSYFKKKKRHISPVGNFTLTIQFILALVGFGHIGIYITGVMIMFMYPYIVVVGFVFLALLKAYVSYQLLPMFSRRYSALSITKYDSVLSLFYLSQFLLLPIKKEDW